MKKTTLSLSIFLSFVCSPVAMAAPDTDRMYGAAKRFTIDTLPPGRLKSHIEQLPPAAQERAEQWLKKFDFPENDLEHLHVDDHGAILYVDDALPEEISQADLENDPTLAGINPVDAFKLHSKPGATNVIYLNFEGYDITGTAWNNSGVATYQAKPFDIDGNTANFSTTERQRIAEAWHRVAEDMAPFDVDVTTERPPFFGPNVGHALITANTDATGQAMPHSGAGGVAYVGVWGASYFTNYQPALVYHNNLGNAAYNIAEATSHEMGHNFGLGHDGTSTASYYTGHGSGLTSWAPVMGVGYYQNVTQWSNGNYADANNTQDDIQIITNKLGLSADDHANNTGSATALLVDENGFLASSNPEFDPLNVRPDNKGVIGTSTDVDVFYFDTNSGDITLSVIPAWDAYTRSSRRGANLDVQARLLDGAGQLIQTFDPTDDTQAVITANVGAGRYYVEVTGVGNSQTPYNQYGSHGEFFISGQVVPFDADNEPPLPNPAQFAVLPQAESRTSISMAAVDSIDDSGVVEYIFSDSQGNHSGWQSDRTYTATGLNPGTTYTYSIQTRDAFGNETTWADNASATTFANTLPEASDDSFTMNQGETATIDVLANDTDSDGDSLSIYSTSNPDSGTVSVSNNKLVFTPFSTFSGNETITYTAQDEFSGRDSATVSIIVNAVVVDNPPIAVDDSVEVLIGSSGNVIDVLANDSDPEGLTLTITNFTNGGKGTVTQSGNTLVYSTNSSKNRGGDVFTYTVTDGNTSTTATVNVQIVRKLSGGSDGGDGGDTGGGSGKCNPKHGCR